MDEDDWQMEADEMTTVVSEVMDKLAAQGSAGQMALFLEQQGVQGLPGYSQHCAIAEYVRREVGGGRVWVNDEAVITQGVTGVHGEVFHSSEEISEFVYKFDQGVYPNLIAGRSAS